MNQTRNQKSQRSQKRNPTRNQKNSTRSQKSQKRNPTSLMRIQNWRKSPTRILIRPTYSIGILQKRNTI
jgi:hypothetical protein